MTRTKNRTGKPAAATSAAHAAPPASPHPRTGPAADGALEVVRAALAATNGDGATTTAIATAAGVSRAAASKALTTLETGGTARREKGTGRGVPDTWHPTEPTTTGTAAGPGSETAAGQPSPGPTPDAPAEPATPPAEPATPPADAAPAPGTTTTDGSGKAASDPAAPPASDPASPPADGPAAPPPPDPAVLAGITENASQITVAAAAVTTALEAGDLGAARRAVEEIRDQATAALRAVKAAAGGSRSGTAARPGQLRELVAAHLAAQPGEEFTPHEIGKIIGRSSGAVANALDRLTELGQATLSCEKPRRYRHTGPAATPATPGDEPVAGAA